MAATLALALTGGNSASADPAVKPRKNHDSQHAGGPQQASMAPLLIAVQKKQQVLDKIANDITQGLPEFDRSKIPGFTEIEVDPDHSHLRLHWKGTPPQRVLRILAHLPSGVTAEVLPSRYSKAELHAARNKLIQGGKPVTVPLSGTATPIRITGIGAAVDGSGLEIGYAEVRGARKQNAADSADPLPRSVRQNRSDQVKARTDRITGIHTVAAYKPLPTDPATPPSPHSQDASPRSATTAPGPTRHNDLAPWYGGSALHNPAGGICASGFGVLDRHGNYLLTTANHCDGSDHQWWTWGEGEAGVNGHPVGKSTRASNSWDNKFTDTVGISLHGEHAAGYLYDGTAKQIDGYAKPVVGLGHNNVGDYVCEDGANGGVHCNIKITRSDYYQWLHGFLVLTDSAYATAQTADGIAGVNGDSGSPVFAGVNGYSADEARGTLTAFDQRVSCPATENENTVLDGHLPGRQPQCFRGMYFVPIEFTLAVMKWRLLTG
ncbi:hypothetical protein ACIQU6_04890 [Streptomyces sp. NPDC090442]|uniref:hypothetical protein n=1 Tax=Streptomyces sp. NPDC090442 TaxID=3365962 RepID=UPI00382EBE91